MDAANAATEEPDLAAGWRRWESSGQHAEDWALLTHQAIATGSPVALERSLAALGRRLSIWRGSGVPDVVTEAVRSLSSPENTWTARIDARRLLPALEVLIDAGDAAAILRLTSAQSGRAAQPGWSGSRTVAETFALVSSALPEGCIAGAPLPATVPPGSYLATCDGTPRLVVLPR